LGGYGEEPRAEGGAGGVQVVIGAGHGRGP
jgi:hypothetical protein